MKSLADRWRDCRPLVAGLHFDSAACSRQSDAAIEAALAHTRHEAEVGGYVAAEAAEPVIEAGRAAVAVLTGHRAADVVFTTGSEDALNRLLGSWPGRRTLACLPGEFGPNLTVMAANDFQVQLLPVGEDGRLLVDRAAAVLDAELPALVHLTALASHRGTAQPLGEMAQLCRDRGIPLVVDAAQALGHLDCNVGADVVYSSSRKWLAGPRGVGVLAVAPALADRLQHRLGAPEWLGAVAPLRAFELGEANIAARVGFAVAVGEHLAQGPASIRARLAEVGRLTRSALDGVAGWRVVEPYDEPTAITTLVPPVGVVPAAVRARLIAEYNTVTTAAEVARAPLELRGPVLRCSPHVDAGGADLEAFAGALEAVTRAA